MLKTSILYVLFFCITWQVNAQHFIDKAVIEYEVRSNVKKTMGNGTFMEMLKDKMPEFKTAYYKYSFADNKSIFQFDRWAESNYPVFITRGEDENKWYFNFNTGKYSMQKNIAGSNIVVEDSIKHLKWKLENENRIIAGFNCRKAVTVLFDSVYVFAFYTEEITIPGGPCSLHGLPGTILGITIPRLYTSWIATKVMLNGVNEIKPISAKKNFSQAELKDLITERTKDWYTNTNDVTEQKELQEAKNRFIWSIYL